MVGKKMILYSALAAAWRVVPWLTRADDDADWVAKLKSDCLLTRYPSSDAEFLYMELGKETKSHDDTDAQLL